MKLLLDFFPIIIFFIVYKTYGLNLAIIAMTLATVVQILYTRFKDGKYEKMQIWTLGLLVVLGGLTIMVNDPAFIMWKLSIIKILFGAFLLATLFTRQTIIEKFLGKSIPAPSQTWRNLTHLWGWSSMAMAFINAYFVLPALETREKFLSSSNGLDTNDYSDLSIVNCVTTHAPQLCVEAQNWEALWVDYKLFGTMGITFVVIGITIFMLRKYINIHN